MSKKITTTVVEEDEPFTEEQVTAAGTSEGVKKGWAIRKKAGVEYKQFPHLGAKYEHVKNQSDEHLNSVIEQHASPEDLEGFKKWGNGSRDERVRMALAVTPIKHFPVDKAATATDPEPEPATDPEICICRDAGSPLPTKKWEFGKPVEFMWLPGGKNVVQAGCAGRTLRVWTLADKGSADAVQASFSAAVTASPRRPPFGCIEHREEEKAYEPQRFSWKDTPEPGIFCTGIPTKLGEANVNGRLQTSFSPCFRHDGKLSTTVCEKCEQPFATCACDGVLYFPDGVRGSESNPAHITGVSEKSVGSLTNWPAFKDILPVTAKEPDKNKAGMTPEKSKVS